MRTIQIGKLNKHVTFVGYKDVENELSLYSKELTDIKTVWATFTPVRGREYYEAQKLREEVTYKLYCRYLPGITSDLYIRYKDKIYEIISVLDVDMEHKMLEIYCVEKVKKVREDG